MIEEKIRKAAPTIPGSFMAGYMDIEDAK